MVATTHSTRTARLRWLWIPCLALSCLVLFCFALGYWVYEPFIVVPLVVYQNLPFTIAVVYGFTLCVWLGLYLKKKTSSKFYGISAFCVSFVLFSGLVFYCARIYNPLPNDEQMIENFKANRADFVEAVRRYREYPRPEGKDSSLWFLEGDTLEVFKRAGIDDIGHAGAIWLPDPYSPQAAKLKEEMWAAKSFKALYKYYSLNIRPASNPRIDHPTRTSPHPYWIGHPLFANIWKEYFFIPEVPRVENNKLLWPMKPYGESDSLYRSSRVLPSLNRLPVPWERPECIYRQIEPQWFIRMCNGH